MWVSAKGLTEKLLPWQVFRFKFFIRRAHTSLGVSFESALTPIERNDFTSNRYEDFAICTSDQAILILPEKLCHIFVFKWNCFHFRSVWTHLYTLFCWWLKTVTGVIWTNHFHLEWECYQLFIFLFFLKGCQWILRSSVESHLFHSML